MGKYIPGVSKPPEECNIFLSNFEKNPKYTITKTVTFELEFDPLTV